MNIKLIAKKYVFQIMDCLGKKTKRYGEISRELQASRKAPQLVHALRALEKEGLCDNIIDGKKSSYSLTPKGFSALLLIKKVIEL